LKATEDLGQNEAMKSQFAQTFKRVLISNIPGGSSSKKRLEVQSNVSVKNY
jgi:hypothetical protein